NTVRTVRYPIAAVEDPARTPRLNCCKNITPITGVRDLASAPERNRHFRIQSVERRKQVGSGGVLNRTISAPPRADRPLSLAYERRRARRGTRPWVKHNRNTEPH